MKKKFVTLLIVGLSLLSMVSIAHAAILDIRNGQLFGAAEVDVDGVLYDVAFRDGTAIELYGGADENTDFPFCNLENPYHDASLTYTAMQALLDQVFIDSELGLFDSIPNLTNGCYANGGCQAFTPVYVFASGKMGCLGVLNSRSGYGADYIFAGGSVHHRTFDTRPISVDYERYDYTVFAVWSEATVVPIPGAVWLFGSGLAGLIGLRKKRK